MQYFSHLPERPFRAIINHIKKVEGRVPKTDQENIEFQSMKAGDFLIFEHHETREILKTEILFVHHYPSFRSLLESEGPENVLSSRGNIEQGIESFNSLSNYRENVLVYGVYAIGIKPVLLSGLPV